MSNPFGPLSVLDDSNVGEFGAVNGAPVVPRTEHDPAEVARRGELRAQRLLQRMGLTTYRLPGSEHIKVENELPNELRTLVGFSDEFEDPKAELYPRYLRRDIARQFDMRPVYEGNRRYRKNDGYTWKHPNEPSREVKFNDWRKVEVTVQDGNQLARFGKCTQETIPAHLNIPEPKAKSSREEKAAYEAIKNEKQDWLNAEKARQFVDFRFRAQSQIPSSALRINVAKRTATDGKRDFKTVYFYGNSLVRSFEYIGLDMFWGENEAAKSDIGGPHAAALTELAENNKLWKTTFHIYGPEDLVPTNGATGRPVWVGYTQNELHSLVKMASDPAFDETLSPGHRLVAKIASCNSFSVLQAMRNIPSALISDLRQVMRSCYWASAIYGNFWWYSHACDGERNAINRADFPFTSIPPPTWMCTGWKISRDRNGNPVKKQPWTFLSYPRLESDFPDSSTQAFHNQLTLRRELDLHGRK